MLEYFGFTLMGNLIKEIDKMNTSMSDPVRQGFLRCSHKADSLKKFCWYVVFIPLIFSACRNDPQPASDSRPVAKVISLPSFSGDSAWLRVEEQVNFGPRVVNTAAHQACGDYMIKLLQEYCDTVYVQAGTAKAWNGEVLRFRNIIGVFKPSELSRIFIAAHWDSRPYADHDPNPAFHHTAIDGANDGASGTGVILELARVLAENPPPQGVDLILFDAEDYGEPQGTERNSMNNWGLGSQHWSTIPHRPGYKARYGILLDMVGVSNPNFTWEGTSRYYAPDVLAMVWRKAAQAGYTSYFSMQETPAIVDDHYFVNEKARIPTIDIIHYDPATPSGFFKYWHTMNDRLEFVDPVSLQMVGDVMIRVIYDPS